MSDEQPPKTEVINSVTVELPQSVLNGCGVIQCRFKISSLFGKRVIFTRRAVISREKTSTALSSDATGSEPSVVIDLGAVLSGFPVEKNGFSGKEIEPTLFFQRANEPESDFHKLKLPEQTFPKEEHPPDNVRSMSASFSCSKLPWVGKSSSSSSSSTGGYLRYKTKIIENLDEDQAETATFSTRCNCTLDFEKTFAAGMDKIYSLPQPVHLTLKLGLEKVEIFPFHPKSAKDLVNNKKLTEQATLSTSFPFSWKMASDLPKADHPELLLRIEIREKETDKDCFRCHEVPIAPTAESMAGCWPVRNSVVPLPGVPAPQTFLVNRNTDEEKVTSQLDSFFPTNFTFQLSLAEETQREQLRAKAKTMLQKIDDAKAQIRKALNKKLEHDEKYHHHDQDGDGHCDEQAGPFIALNQLRERVVLFAQKMQDNEGERDNLKQQLIDDGSGAINDIVGEAKELLSPEKIASQLKSVEQCLRAFTASIKNPFVDPGQAFQVAMEEILPPGAAAKVAETFSVALGGLKTFQGDLVSAAGKAADAVADLLAPVASAALGALGNVLGELGSAVAGVAADVVSAVPFIGMFVAPLISIGKKIYKQYNEKKLADEECEKLLSRLSEHFEWFKRYQDFTKLLEKRGAQVRKLLAKAQLTIADCFDAVQEDKKTSSTMKFITASGRQEKFASLRADLDATFALIEKEIQFGFMFETLGEVKDISAKIDRQMAEEAKRAAEMQAQMKELATLMPGQMKKRAKELTMEAASVLVEQTKQTLRRCVRSVHPEMILEVPNEMGRSIQFSLDKKYVPIVVRQYNSSVVSGAAFNSNGEDQGGESQQQQQQDQYQENNNINRNKYTNEGITYQRTISLDGAANRDFNDGDDDAMLIGGRIVARKSEALLRASTAGGEQQPSGGNNNNKNRHMISTKVQGGLQHKQQQQQSSSGGGELQDLNTYQFADRISRSIPNSKVVVLDGVSSIGKTSFAQKLCIEQAFHSHVAVYFSVARFINSSNSSNANHQGEGGNSRFWKLLRRACSVSAMSDFMIHVIEEQRIPILWVIDDIELVQTNAEAIEFLQEFVCPVGRFEHAADGDDGIVRQQDLVLAVMRDPHRTAPGVDFFSDAVPADRWGVRSWDPESVKLLPEKFFRVACAPDAKRCVEQINNCLKESPSFQTSPFFAQLLCELVLRGGATADRIKKGKLQANTTQLLELVVKESWNRDSTFNKIKDRYGSVVHSESTFELMINGAGYHALKYMRRQVSLEFTVNIAPDNWAWLLTQADLTQFAGYQQRVFLDLSYVEYFAAQYILRHMDTINTIPWDNDQRVVWMHVATLLACDVDRLNERDKLLDAIGNNVAREYNNLPAQDRIFGWKYDAARWGKYRRDLALNLLGELATILDAGYRKFPRIGKPSSKNGGGNNNKKSSSSSSFTSSDDSDSVKSETFEAILRAMDWYEAEDQPVVINLSGIQKIGTWLGKKIPTVGGPVGDFIKKSQETARNARLRATAAYNVTNRPWMLWLVEPCGRTACQSGIEWLKRHVLIDENLWNEALYGAFESKPSFSPILLEQGAKVELRKACQMGAHNAVRSLIQVNKAVALNKTSAAPIQPVVLLSGAAAASSSKNNNNNNNHHMNSARSLNTNGNNNNNNNNNNQHSSSNNSNNNDNNNNNTMKLSRHEFISALKDCLLISADTRQSEVAFELLDGVAFSRAGLSLTAALRCVRDGPKSIAKNLTRLDLRDCALGNDGAIEVLEAPLPHLEVLSLAKNEIGPAGFEFFARVAPLTLPKLQYVNLSHNSGFLCGILMVAPALLNMKTLVDVNICKNGVVENFRERYTNSELVNDQLSVEGKLIKAMMSQVMRGAFDSFGLDGACFQQNDDVGYGSEGIRRLLWIFDSASRTKPLQRVSFAGSRCGVAGMTYLFESDRYQYGEISCFSPSDEPSSQQQQSPFAPASGSSGMMPPISFFDDGTISAPPHSPLSPTSLKSIPNPPQLLPPAAQQRADMFSRLIELDLSSCNMDGNAIQKLYDALVTREPPKWRSLALASNPIGCVGGGGVVALSELLRFLADSPLTILNLRSCQLGVESFFNLHGPLKLMRKLKSIDLSDNNMNSPSVFGLVADIQNIEIVNLARNNLELLTLVEVAPHLEKMSRVVNLDVSFNSIDESSLRQMKKKLPRKEALLMFQ